MGHGCHTCGCPNGCECDENASRRLELHAFDYKKNSGDKKMTRLNGNRVAIKVDEVTTSAGGLHLIGATGKLRTGTVVSASDEYHTNFGVVRSKFCVGDRVLVDELGGLVVKLDDQDVLIVRNDDVIGTL